MKIILLMVTSLDGKTTRWNESRIFQWTSKEDQDNFSSLIKKKSLLIMGRKTFDAAKKMIKLSPKILHVVFTTEPEKYLDLVVPGQLEFVNGSAINIINKLDDRGYKEALLLGGEHLNTEFFKEKLVNEVWLTLEPYLFGIGNQLVLSEKLNIDLTLQSITKLNKKGTLLLKYEANKN
ncbi:MAG: hypothetical protein JWO40_765 [Candidatus Doudnabacteria bacterium]|nr:hypothetical protein [Candidatus Doudnabacteria bacterium]